MESSKFVRNLITNDKNFKSVISQIAEAAGFLWDRGWAEKNAGNISVNISSIIGDSRIDFSEFSEYKFKEQSPYLDSMFFIVSAAGSKMRDLSRQPLDNMVIVHISSNGRMFNLLPISNSAAELFPSSELPTHLAVHQVLKIRNSSRKAVIHSHADELIALTQIAKFKNEKEINRLIWGMHPESMLVIPKGIGFVPYKVTGSVQLAQATIEKITDHDIVLWEKHGVFAVGDTIAEAFDLIDVAVKSAKIFFMCRSAGFEPEGLTEKQIEELRAIVDFDKP